MKRVKIVPLQSNEVCHNINCRIKLQSTCKYIGGFQPHYEAALCMNCYRKVLFSGFTYNDEYYAAPEIKDQSKKPKAWILKALTSNGHKKC